jgi:hypothetical protein
MSPLLALSWPNLPCALKTAIGFGKRTLGHHRQSAAPQGPQQRAYYRVREPIVESRIAFDSRRRRFAGALF